MSFHELVDRISSLKADLLAKAEADEGLSRKVERVLRTFLPPSERNVPLSNINFNIQKDIRVVNSLCLLSAATLRGAVELRGKIKSGSHLSIEESLLQTLREWPVACHGTSMEMYRKGIAWNGKIIAPLKPDLMPGTAFGAKVSKIEDPDLQRVMFAAICLSCSPNDRKKLQEKIFLGQKVLNFMAGIFSPYDKERDAALNVLETTMAERSRMEFKIEVSKTMRVLEKLADCAIPNSLYFVTPAALDKMAPKAPEKTRSLAIASPVNRIDQISNLLNGLVEQGLLNDRVAGIYTDYLKTEESGKTLQHLAREKNMPETELKLIIRGVETKLPPAFKGRSSRSP